MALRTKNYSERAEWISRVRYISPFRSTAWKRLEEAERLLREDEALYVRLDKLGLLSEPQREIGPPRIQTAKLRSDELGASQVSIWSADGTDRRHARPRQK